MADSIHTILQTASLVPPWAFAELVLVMLWRPSLSFWNEQTVLKSFKAEFSASARDTVSRVLPDLLGNAEVLLGEEDGIEA